MSVKVLFSAFVVLLFNSSAVQSQESWGVTYISTKICAFKGSTVKMHCKYKYPPRINGNATVIEKAVWFTKKKGKEPVDLKTEVEYADRVEYHCGQNECTLMIKDLRKSDSTEYKFSFLTNQPGAIYTTSCGVHLTVTDLQVKVDQTSPYLWPSWAEVTCRSTCHVTGSHSFIWFQNGQRTQDEQSSLKKYFGYDDSISCAVREHEMFPSPSACIRHPSCNKVTYTERHICALKGSSVDISSTYSPGHVTSRFWFIPPYHNRRFLPDNRRVKVHETVQGRSTLSIKDLRDTDSAEYRFKFKTQQFEWGSDLPGTTLTVTTLQVQVNRIITVHESYTDVELKCDSNCKPAGHLSYIWFKNGQKNMSQQTSTYRDHFHPADNISCALEGRELHRSPALYPSKLPSLSVSPSGEIVEGISVHLTCRNYADPAANNILYKGNQTLPLASGGVYHFSSISSEDRGTYYCMSENNQSVSLFLDVQYAPKLPSVSVSPSGVISEGTSVTLTCSSDANPAANYTWYKEDEDSPKASGQKFTITDFRAEHGGNYYCEAQNSRGRQNSSFQLIKLKGSWKFPVALGISAALLVLIVVPLLLWFRREMSMKEQLTAEEEPDRTVQMDEIQYASVNFSGQNADPIYSNCSTGRFQRHEEESETYAKVREVQAVEDASMMYSTVRKKRRQ